jgi:hypothetical protein
MIKCFTVIGDTFTVIFRSQSWVMQVPVTVLSEAMVLIAWSLRLWVQTPLMPWLFMLVFLCVMLS